MPQLTSFTIVLSLSSNIHSAHFSTFFVNISGEHVVFIADRFKENLSQESALTPMTWSEFCSVGIVHFNHGVSYDVSRGSSHSGIKHLQNGNRILPIIFWINYFLLNGKYGHRKIHVIPFLNSIIPTCNLEPQLWKHNSNCWQLRTELEGIPECRYIFGIFPVLLVLRACRRNLVCAGDPSWISASTILEV